MLRLIAWVALIVALYVVIMIVLTKMGIGECTWPRTVCAR